ncbi:hypothetical protein EON76_02480 [bacterium]|nr:MAG: hypothetical protein EON76_02480 [bacterium]
MNDNEQVADNVSPPRVTESNPRSYVFLVNMSKRLGAVATKSFVEVKQFLNHEVTFTSSERFMNGIAKIRSQKQRDSNTDTTEDLSHLKKEDDVRGESRVSEEKTRAANKGETEVDSGGDLHNVIKQSHETLASANTVFPMTLFPDTVFVDRTKVTIIRRDFFWSSDTMSIRIEDVLNVSATVGPVFGSLTIASRVMSTIDHFQIRHFWRNDAIYMKRIIQGYVIAQHNKIDTAHLSKQDLIETLLEIGNDKQQ